MKKIIYSMLFVLLNSYSWAELPEICATGVVEIGQNGKCYCRNYGRSDERRLTLFSAYTWCQAQGYSLSTIHSACDNGDEKWDSSKPTVCPNFKQCGVLRSTYNQELTDGERAVGTLVPNGDNTVFRVQIPKGTNGNGLVTTNIRYDTFGWYWCDIPQSECERFKNQ